MNAQLKNGFLLILMMTVLLTGCYHRHSPSSSAENPDGYPYADLILVHKAERKLSLVHDDKIYKTYDIALGQNPKGHKRYEGDSRTPEGHYYIDGRNPDSLYYLSLSISYPDEDDITFAQENGRDPGKHIMIHGMKAGEGTRAHFLAAGDWTQGCIAVTNDEMYELWHLIEDGTPIKIYP
jgi:murein L,D-transpeptidase YafK